MQRHKKLSARILSMALTVAMVCTMMPATVFAAEGDVPLGASSITECHPAHDEDCGYLEALEGVACSHLNEDGTYSCAPVLDSGDVSGNAATPSDAEKEYVCDHADGCGYAEAIKGTPCTHECEQCKVQDSGNPPLALAPKAAQSGDGWSFENGTLTITSNDGASAWGDRTGISSSSIKNLILTTGVTEISQGAFIGVAITSLAGVSDL